MPNTLDGFPEAVAIPHKHFWPGRSGHRIRYVIIHGTAWPGPIDAQGVARFFATTDKETGTHYVIGKDGAIVQCCNELDASWGNGILDPGHDPWWGTRGNPNLETVSIEHVKWHMDNSDSLTPEQWEASARLISYLCRKYSIPGKWADAEGGITGHFSIAPITKKLCPGPYPWEDLFGILRNPGAPPAIGMATTDPRGSQRPTPSDKSAYVSNASGSTGPKTPGAAAHATLRDLPGFAGVVGGLDSASAFAPYDASAGGFAWVGRNGMTLGVRVLLIGLGVLLLLALLGSLAGANGWMRDAGAEVPALMMQSSRKHFTDREELQ